MAYLLHRVNMTLVLLLLFVAFYAHCEFRFLHFMNLFINVYLCVYCVRRTAVVGHSSSRSDSCGSNNCRLFAINCNRCACMCAHIVITTTMCGQSANSARHVIIDHCKLSNKCRYVRTNPAIFTKIDDKRSQIRFW